MPQALRLRHRRQVPVEQRPRQRQLDLRRHHGELLQHPLRERVQAAHPRQHGVHHGGRHPGPRCGQHLRDEERIAPGEPVQRRRGLAGTTGPARHCPRGTAAATPTRCTAGPDSPPSTRCNGCAGPTSSKPIGDHQHGWHIRDASPPRNRSTSTVASSAQCASSTISTVGTRGSASSSCTAVEHRVPVSAGQRRSQRPAAHRERRVPQRTQRPRGQQVVTRPEQDPRHPTRTPPNAAPRSSCRCRPRQRAAPRSRRRPGRRPRRHPTRPAPHPVRADRAPPPDRRRPQPVRHRRESVSSGLGRLSSVVVDPCRPGRVVRRHRAAARRPVCPVNRLVRSACE